MQRNIAIIPGEDQLSILIIPDFMETIESMFHRVQFLFVRFFGVCCKLLIVAAAARPLPAATVVLVLALVCVFVFVFALVFVFV